MKQGTNASLVGSSVLSRQPDEGIIFLCFVHSRKQSDKNTNDSNTFSPMRNESWTNNTGRKQKPSLRGGVVVWNRQPHVLHTQRCTAESSENGSGPSKARHGVCSYQTKTGNNTWEENQATEHSWEISTTEREKQSTTQSNCILTRIDNGREELGWRSPAALLHNLYVTPQLPSSFCRLAMGIKGCISAIKSGWCDLKLVSNCDTLRHGGPLFPRLRFIKKKKKIPLMRSLKSALYVSHSWSVNRVSTYYSH